MGEWVCGSMDLSGEFAKTAALIDHRMTTQDGLEFFLWFKEQTGIEDHLMGNPFVWSHDQLELNEDYMRFIRITGTPSTALTHLGILSSTRTARPNMRLPTRRAAA